MAYISMVPEGEAEGNLKDLYDKYRAPWGGLDNILKIHGLLPRTLTPHHEFYKSVMFGPGPLSRPQREMIASVVSKANGCTYCLHHHGDALLRVTKDRSLADGVRKDFRTASITGADRLMLEYAEHLTVRPTEDFSTGISRLREGGFSDEAVLHITLIVGYFNFVNRIANGLGVELEPYWKEDGYSDPAKPMAHDDR
jgi:uncharacterized peroxidase-related enzyme